MFNTEIRNEAKRLNVKHWQIADYIGVSEKTFMRRMRKELPDDQQTCILKAIEAIAEYKREQEVKHREA